MEPKFQSSFIPKGPAASVAPSSPREHKSGDRNILHFSAVIIFIGSIIFAAGTFGYKFYLNYSIVKMRAKLETAQVELKPEVIKELTRLDNQIISTQKLISTHHVLTSLFKFLETSTPVNVRFKSFNYSVNEEGFIHLSMMGEARGYAALARQAEIFNGSEYLKDSIFSNFELNNVGDVTFSFETTIDPSLVSYQMELERSALTNENELDITNN